MEVPFEKRFHFRDGTSVSTLEHLKRKIETISYQEFYHHANAQRNDFAEWVLHVLHEERLADEMRKVTSIVETVEIINDFLHPRATIMPRSDMQARIEQSLFNGPVATEVNETAIAAIIEQIVPAVEQPVQLTKPKVEFDFRIIEEKSGVNDTKADARVREELFGTTTVQAAVQQPVARETPKPVATEHDNTRMIVKDFIYGLLFGFLIGLLAGRIVS